MMTALPSSSRPAARPAPRLPDDLCGFHESVLFCTDTFLDRGVQNPFASSTDPAAEKIHFVRVYRRLSGKIGFQNRVFTQPKTPPSAFSPEPISNCSGVLSRRNVAMSQCRARQSTFLTP